jgi:predicted transcriptional regulator
MSELVQCQIEGCMYEAKTLRDHVSIHGMTTNEYKQKYGKHSLVSDDYLLKLLISGNKASKAVDDRVYRHKCRNDYCDVIIDGKALVCAACKAKQQTKLLELQKLKFKDMIENRDFVVCKICGWCDTRISGHIMSAHDMNKREYRSKYGNDAQLMCDDVSSKTAFRGTHSIETRRQMAISHMKRNVGAK